MVSRRSALLGAGISAFALVLPVSADETTDANKQLAQRYLDEVWTAGNVNAIGSLISPDYTPSDPNDAPGLDALKARLQSRLRLYSALVSDLTYAVVEMTAEANRVVIRSTASGTSRDGKKLSAAFFSELQIKDGLIVSLWNVIDMDALNDF